MRPANRDTLQGKSRNWLRQRQRILSVAGRLFWQKGYMATSIDDIAAAAKVNTATIYYYFENKSEILYEAISEAAEAFNAIVERVVDSDLPPQEKLGRLVVEPLKWQMSNIGLAGLGQLEKRNLPPKLARAYIQQRDRVETAFRKVVGAVMAQGNGRNRDPKLTTLFILGLMNSISQWYKPNGEFSPEEVASEALKFVSNAFSVPPPASGGIPARKVRARKANL